MVIRVVPARCAILLYAEQSLFAICGLRASVLAVSSLVDIVQ